MPMLRPAVRAAAVAPSLGGGEGDGGGGAGGGGGSDGGEGGDGGGGQGGGGDGGGGYQSSMYHEQGWPASAGVAGPEKRLVSPCKKEVLQEDGAAMHCWLVR